MTEPLIDRLRDGDQDALNELVAAAPSVVSVLRALAEEQPPGLLVDAVVALSGPETVPLLVEHLSSDSIDVLRAATAALGRSRDERALDPLLSMVADQDRLQTDRSFAAEALGILGSPRAKPVMSDAIDEQRPDLSWNDYPVLLTTAATALARLGDHSGLDATLEALRSEHDAARLLAARALELVTGRGVTTALAERVADPWWEVRSAAVTALALLGTTPAVEAMIPACQDETDEVALHALARIGDILDEEFGADDGEEEARETWQRHRASFQPQTCYRLRRPLHVSDLLDEWEAHPDRRADIEAEMTVITGIFVSETIRAQGIDSVRRRISSENFVDGALYKWGRRAPLD